MNLAIIISIFRYIMIIIDEFVISNLMTPINIVILITHFKSIIINFINSASEFLLALIQFLVILAVTIPLFLIARRIGRKERGIVVMPFDTFSDDGSDGGKEKHDGKAVSDLLTYEIQKISNIHNQEIREIPIKIPQTTHLFKQKFNIYSETMTGLFPKSETLEYSVSEMGTVKTGFLELSLGQLLTAFKRLLPEEYRHDIITGSLQKYGPNINIIAYMEGKGVHAWKVGRKISEKDNYREDRIQLMVKNLAYQIAHQLVRREEEDGPAVSAESWLAWKYYTEALEAYHRYARSNNRAYDRNKAKKNCLLALKMEPGYDKPLELLSYLGFFYINEKDKNEAQEIFNRVRERKPDLAARGLGILNLTERNYKDALMYFKMAIDANKRDAMAWFGKGMAHEGSWDEKKLSEKYAFCWDNIPGKDNDRLIKFLGHTFNIDWAKNAKIEEIENGKTVRVSTEKNYLCLELISKDEATLKVDGGRIEKLKVTTEKGKRYICPKKIKDYTEIEEAVSEVQEHNETQAFRGSASEGSELYGTFTTVGDEVAPVEEGPVVEVDGYCQDNDPPLYDSILFANSQDQELKDALEAFDKTIQIDPNHSEAWYHKGLIHCKREELEDAENAFVKALNIEPKNANVWYHKGVILSRRDNYEDAIESFDEVIKIDPQHFGEGSKELPSHPYVTLSWLYKGVSQSKLSEYFDADHAYSKALETDPKNALAWYCKGINQMKRGDYIYYIEALDAFSQAVDIKRDYPSAWFMKAFCQLIRRAPELSLNAADKALVLDSQNSALLDLKGFVLASLGKYEDALIYFNQATELDPENAFTWNRKYLAIKALCLSMEAEEVSLFGPESGGILSKALGLDKEAEEASAKADELGYVVPPPLIKVEFKTESIRADQGQIVVNSIRQVSENDLSRVLISSDEEIIMAENIPEEEGLEKSFEIPECLSYLSKWYSRAFARPMVHRNPLKFEEDYELVVTSVGTDDDRRVALELMKDGQVCDSMEIGDEARSTYEYPNMTKRRMNDMRGLRKSVSNILEQAFYNGLYGDIFEIGFSLSKQDEFLPSTSPAIPNRN